MKAVTLLELLTVTTDVERLFAPHQWASCIRPNDSQISSLRLERHRSRRTEAFLLSRPPQQPLLPYPQLSMDCRRSRSSISHSVRPQWLNANTLTRPRPALRKP